MKEVTDEEEADIRLLSMANYKNKFAVELGFRLTEGQQDSLERGIDNQWFTLVDVTPIESAPGRVMRIFRLTEAGVKRLAELVSLKTLSH